MTLSKTILHQSLQEVKRQLLSGASVNVVDEYGYTPLIEAVLVEDRKKNSFAV